MFNSVTEPNLKMYAGLKEAYPIKMEISELAQKVENLERIKELCGSIILTLTLERNQPVVPNELKEIVMSWKKTYEAYK